MPPFTILTNGLQSIIFDTITGEKLNGVTIDINHHYIKDGFKVSGDVLQAYSEALNYLISISSDNLMAFCSSQVETRMKLLKSSDLRSGKKYIPQLYVDRKKAKTELNEKLLDKEHASDLVLIVGPPQHGKTSFLCHSADNFLEQNIPCLFFPAISLKNGLLHAIQEDFKWNFGQDLSASQIARRLNQILEKSNGNLLIFVDGWNEMLDQVLILNDECLKLSTSKIKVIISTTSPSLNRLLIDEAGNPCLIADKININISQIKSLLLSRVFNKIILSDLDSYQGKKKEQLKSFLEDLQRGGCMSGMVSEFIYHADCRKFYIEHLDDLEDIRRDI